MNRFDYVKYSDLSVATQEVFKKHFLGLEELVSDQLESSRAKALVMTKLEEAYMWVGKAIRDDQLKLEDGDSNVKERD